MLGVALHCNDKAGRDRVVSHAIVDEMTMAGWIQKADDLPQRLESWEITGAPAFACAPADEGR